MRIFLRVKYLQERALSWYLTFISPLLSKAKNLLTWRALFFKSVDSLFRFYGELTQLACPVQWAVPSLNPIIPSFPQDCQGGTPAGRLPAQDPRGQLPLSLHVSCKRWSQDYGGHSRSSAAKVENSLWIKKKQKKNTFHYTSIHNHILQAGQCATLRGSCDHRGDHNQLDLFSILWLPGSEVDHHGVKSSCWS